MATTRRTNIDQQPKSEFQQQAEAIWCRRLAARTVGEKRAAERALADLLATHRGRRAWDAVRDAEPAQLPRSVPRDTSADRSCHASAGGEATVRDHKMAAAGPEGE